MVCAECMKMCCLGGKNSVVKDPTYLPSPLDNQPAMVCSLLERMSPSVKIIWLATLLMIYAEPVGAITLIHVQQW